MRTNNDSNLQLLGRYLHTLFLHIREMLQEFIFIRVRGGYFSLIMKGKTDKSILPSYLLCTSSVAKQTFHFTNYTLLLVCILCCLFSAIMPACTLLNWASVSSHLAYIHVPYRYNTSINSTYHQLRETLYVDVTYQQSVVSPILVGGACPSLRSEQT